ncbi:MAG: SRPBCC family protein [Planctomycetota bacterium]|nr:SRPBCC family protein [Planctomycetota bacterium]
MKTREFSLQTTCWLPISCTDVFDFFSDAFQLESITPGWLKFKVLTPQPIAMQKGTHIDYRLRLHGLPVFWTTEITDWMPPVSFQDSQARGPYSLWIHTHTFEEIDGGTLVRDQVRYRVFGGALVHSLFVKRDLRRIFSFRQEQLPKLLGVEPADCRLGDIDIN